MTPGYCTCREELSGCPRCAPSAPASISAEDFRCALERIAQSVAMLPGGKTPTIHLGVSDEAVVSIARIGGTGNITLYGSGHSIKSAEIEIGGVLFRAQSDARPLTDAERARVAADGRESTMRYVAVTP